MTTNEPRDPQAQPPHQRPADPRPLPPLPSHPQQPRPQQPRTEQPRSEQPSERFQRPVSRDEEPTRRFEQPTQQFQQRYQQPPTQQYQSQQAYQSAQQRPQQPTSFQQQPTQRYGRTSAPVQPGASVPFGQVGVTQRPPQFTGQAAGQYPTQPSASPQFGAPFGVPLPQQPAGADASSDTRSGRKKKRGRGTIAVLSILLPLGIIGGLFGGYLLADQYQSFDERKVEYEVAEVLRNDYGLSDLETVNCPSWIKVKQGDEFQCEFEYAGATQTITVTQGSQSGQLIVGSPRQ